MENSLLWHEQIKQKRIDYGLTQRKLALASDVPRQRYCDIENNKVNASSKVKEKIEYALNNLNPDNNLEMLFDYVRIRFPTTDYELVIHSILQLNINYMLHEDYAFYSYDEHFVFGDIVVMISNDITKGVLLELKGKGCRQFESFLLAQERTWFDFFITCLTNKGVFKRLDLAINDKAGILDIPELAYKCDNQECISVFRNFKNYRSGELVHRNEKADMGNTLYIGSLQSEVYFCIYEKDYEQYVKNDIPLEEAIVKNRFEIRLKNDRAKFAVNDLLSHQDAEDTAFKIINRYIRFVDKDINKRRSDWKINERWLWFKGSHRNRLKLTTKPEPYNFDKTLRWLERQVAPTLKLTRIIDSKLNTDVLESMINDAKLTDQHEKILKQQTTDVNKIIIKEGNDK